MATAMRVQVIEKATARPRVYMAGEGLALRRPATPAEEAQSLDDQLAIVHTIDHMVANRKAAE